MFLSLQKSVNKKLFKKRHFVHLLTKNFLSKPQVTEKHHLLPLAKKQAKQHNPSRGMISKDRNEEVDIFRVNEAEILYFYLDRKVKSKVKVFQWGPRHNQN